LKQYGQEESIRACVSNSVGFFGSIETCRYIGQRSNKAYNKCIVMHVAVSSIRLSRTHANRPLRSISCA